MNIKEICELRSQIDDLVNAHPDELKKHFFNAVQDCGNIDESAEIKKQYDDIVVPGRLLHIGIVGRVKAGKSSLLNSLFFGGKNVLPKAATPMTAALTKLFYSENTVVRINFIDQNDKERIERKAKEYEDIFKTKVEEMLNRKRENAKKRNEKFNGTEKRKDCERLIRSELEENSIVLAGAAEQYKLLKKVSSDVLTKLGKTEEKTISSLENITNELAEYVGANGKYTAITRDVELGFPFEQLKDVVVVDTPGFDDPVPSRDAAARESLKKCDAIFILSPAGQFLNDQDRINIEKIESGEGIQHIYIIASKIDAELGNESKDQSDGSIKKELDLIVENISTTLGSIVDGFKYDEKLYKHFTEDLKKGALYTSGMCQSMYESWEKQDEIWDNDQKDTWERLQLNYPEYFSVKNNTAKETLKLIGNIQTIKDKLLEVKNQKDSILSEKENNFLNAKADMVKKLVTTLKENFDEELETIENGDIEALKAEQKELSKNIENLKIDFEEELDVVFEDFINACEDKCKNILEQFYDRTGERLSGTTGSKDEQRTGTRKEDYTVTVKDPGIWGGIKRLFGGGYHQETRTRNVKYTYTETVNTINASEARRYIEKFAVSLANVIRREMSNERTAFRNKLKSIALQIWGKYEIAEFYSGRNRETQAAKIMRVIPDNTISIDWELPYSLESGGHLTGSDADEFEETCRDEMVNIEREYSYSIDSYISDLKKSLNTKKATNDIVSEMEKNLKELIKKLDEREVVLDTYKRIEAEINDFIKR